MSDYLTCAHCGSKFQGTKSQRNHFKYEGGPTYCSQFCRTTGISTKLRTPKPQYGPCPTCGQMFESRKKKLFCSHPCYCASPQFKQMLAQARLLLPEVNAKINAEFRNKNQRSCVQCQTLFYHPPAKKKKFCSKLCQRRYFNERFDRWSASPERIALPQNFDEFLCQEELPCLIDGCDWHGHFLSAHMNRLHGVNADDFKRAAGFNLSTGVVSAPMHEQLSARQLTGVALAPLADERINNPVKRSYHSLEGREHRAKARALAAGGPMQVCQNCQKTFQQTTPYGKAKYCGKNCQTEAIKKRIMTKQHQLICTNCQQNFLGNRYQYLRAKRGLNVTCSVSCRNFIAGSTRRGTHYRKRTT